MFPAFYCFFILLSIHLFFFICFHFFFPFLTFHLLSRVKEEKKGSFRPNNKGGRGPGGPNGGRGMSPQFLFFFSSFLTFFLFSSYQAVQVVVASVNQLVLPFSVLHLPLLLCPQLTLTSPSVPVLLHLSQLSSLIQHLLAQTKSL